MPTASMTLSGPLLAEQCRGSRRRRRRRPRSRSMHLGAVGRGACEPFGDEVDADDPRCAEVRGDATRHRADRPEPEDDDGAAVRDGRVLDGLPRRRQHVGEVHEAVVGRAVRDLDRAVLRLRHAQQLGLGARHLAVELRVAEQRRALVVLAHLRRLALRLQPASRTSQQCPHEMLNGITTRSPGAMWVTAEPTASTMPIGSWPRMSPSVMNGAITSYRWRSEPHSPLDVIRTIASVGSSIVGSGTVSTRTSRRPCHTAALIVTQLPRTSGRQTARSPVDHGG